uniref:Uncharacterized protein n=1 Tax=Romanomermis culicivorax TaxID=13658 RepID=A0A915HKA6_ROMCU
MFIISWKDDDFDNIWIVTCYVEYLKIWSKFTSNPSQLVQLRGMRKNGRCCLVSLEMAIVNVLCLHI